MARLINIITWLFIGISLILTALFTIPSLFGYMPYVVLSGSMEPVYPVGSLIYVAPVDANSLKPGDAITFDRNDAVVTHQVYEVNADSKTVMTQGVANVDSDGSIMHDVEPVSFSQVLGTPVFCIPYLGYVNVFCTTMPGILIVALVALALIAASYATSGMRRKAAAAQ